MTNENGSSATQPWEPLPEQAQVAPEVQTANPESEQEMTAENGSSTTQPWEPLPEQAP